MAPGRLAAAASSGVHSGKSEPDTTLPRVPLPRADQREEIRRVQAERGADQVWAGVVARFRSGTMRPRRWASHRKTTVSIRPKPTAYVRASGPNSPPLTRVGPEVTPSRSPSGALWPETSVPKTPAPA